MNSALLKPSKHDVYPFIDPKQNLKGAASGKSVLITGAGAGGIGRAIAEAFALAGAASVILVARRTEPLEATKASIVALVPECDVLVAGGTDIASQDSVEKLFAGLPTVPDIVVSNAAVSSCMTSVAESEVEAWWRDYDINVRGTYLVARTYIRAVRSNGKGSGGLIINVSSNACWRYIPGLSSYAGSKIAVNSLTEYIDREESIEGGSGVRCVAMHPGGVITELSSGSGMSPDIRKMLIDTPELSGATAVYLSTVRARFLMGRYVNATWDVEELEQVKDRVEKEDLLKSRVVGIA